jgi:hypothetical protein
MYVWVARLTPGLVTNFSSHAVDTIRTGCSLSARALVGFLFIIPISSEQNQTMHSWLEAGWESRILTAKNINTRSTTIIFFTT